MIFSLKEYSKVKTRLKNRYRKLLKQIQKSLPAQSHCFEWMEENSSELLDYSPIKWYFLKQVEHLSFFISLPSNFSDPNEFSSLDDDVFEKWNQSEFAEIFLKFLNRGMTVSQASHKTALFMDHHLVSLGGRHILKDDYVDKYYRLQPSLGDLKKGSKLSKLLETTLHLEGKELRLMTKTLTEMKDFSTRIEVALRVIHRFSPNSWERFKAFTEVIIPINQEELVSYSHQELPGTSMINLYHRDFVDLIDDLIHENGHHHLNYYLNLEDLIQEPVDCIYYSPWRRTLRPFRGIYHAYFTFFWAFQLFMDFSESKDLVTQWYIFDAHEREKIFWRAVEEYWMLDFAFQDLKWAKKKGLISDSGYKLIQGQKLILDKYKTKVFKLEKQLVLHKSDLIDLKRELKQAAKKYKK